MTDYQGGVRVAAFATGGLIPPAMRGTKVLGAMHVCDVHAAFCALGGVSDCRDPVVGLPDIDGVDVSSLFFVPEPDKSTVVGNASSPRQCVDPNGSTSFASCARQPAVSFCDVCVAPAAAVQGDSAFISGADFR